MAVALLAACSDKDPLGEGPDNGIGNPGENIGDGYVAVQINLPTNVVSAAPRATNDNFDDGTPNEYRVSNGALLLFTAASTDKEGDAVFKAAYDLNLESYWISKPDQSDNITTSNLVAVQVTNPAQTGEKLYGLVMVNFRNVAGVGEDNTLQLKAADGSSTAFSGKFSDLVNKISDCSFYTGSGTGATNFFMTNAPLSSVDDKTKPEASNVTTLVDITDGIKRTRLEAENAPAGSFFVERAVAKATLSVTANNGLNVGTGENAVHFTADNIEWTLNATNTKVVYRAPIWANSTISATRAPTSLSVWSATRRWVLPRFSPRSTFTVHTGVSTLTMTAIPMTTLPIRKTRLLLTL